MMVDAPQFVPDPIEPAKKGEKTIVKKNEPKTKKAQLLNFLKSIPQ